MPGTMGSTLGGQLDWLSGEAVEASAMGLEMPVSFALLAHEDIFICDTGASSHATNSKKGATNIRMNGSSSLGHAGEAVETKMTIDIPGQFIGLDGSPGMVGTLTDCNYNPGLNFNLISLTRMLRKGGWKIVKGDHMGIVIEHPNGGDINFDVVIETPKGAIYACRFIRTAEVATVNTEAGTTMNVHKAHGLLGHIGEEATRLTAKQLGWTITRGALGPCLHCARSKARQKNVTQESGSEKSHKPGERLYLDLSVVTVARDDGEEATILRKNWKIVVCEATGKKWSDFTETKKGMVERTCEFLHKMKTRGIVTRHVRLDPSGENTALAKRAESVEWKELQPIDFEFTARDTPQHNSLAELAFPYLGGRARAMMGAAHVPVDLRYRVAVEAVRCATQLDGLVVVTLNDKTCTRDEHVYGKVPKWATKLRTYGEAGVVKEGKDGKTGDRGQDMMFVGYAVDRDSDCVRMYNPETNRVVQTRDVIWLKRMYYEKPEPAAKIEINDDNEATTENENPESSTGETNGNEIDESGVGDVDADASTTVASNLTRTRYGRVVKPPERLSMESMQVQTELPSTAVELKYLSNMAELDNWEVNAVGITVEDTETFLVGAGIGGGFGHTTELKVMNYNQAMKGDDVSRWKQEVRVEKERFDKYNAVTAVKRKDIPAGVKLLTSTWAMKKKTNGKFRARLNAHGFKQVQGMHYIPESISAPVTNPNTIRIAMTLWAMNAKWIAVVLDVEGAFLQGKFKDGEELYMSIPQGWEEFYPGDVVLRMNVPIYGTKQAGACFYRTLVESIKERRYNRSKADPCLYYVWRDGRLSLCLSWVDDILALGEKQDVERIQQDLESKFTCKREGPLKEYVGSKIDLSRDENGLGKLKFTQPVLVQKLQDEFDLSEGRIPKTPAAPGQELIKSNGGNDLHGKQVTTYRSGTAICMFIMQWSRPDIYNATRALSRHMSAPTTVHEEALRRLMKYVVATRNRGLVLSPDAIWDGSSDFKFTIHGRSDSNYATNPDDRRSVSGGRVFLNGAPIMFRSGTQKFVTLSVTEAETAAGVTVAQDMLYVYRLLKSIGLRAELPMLLEIDNSGAVDLANNWNTGGRTRHVDVRNYFLRELRDEGVIRVSHVPGDENDADIFTKNTETRVFEKHIPMYVGYDEYLKRNEEEKEDE